MRTTMRQSPTRYRSLGAATAPQRCPEPARIIHRPEPLAQKLRDAAGSLPVADPLAPRRRTQSARPSSRSTSSSVYVRDLPARLSIRRCSARYRSSSSSRCEDRLAGVEGLGAPGRLGEPVQALFISAGNRIASIVGLQQVPDQYNAPQFRLTGSPALKSGRSARFRSELYGTPSTAATMWRPPAFTGFHHMALSDRGKLYPAEPGGDRSSGDRAPQRYSEPAARSRITPSPHARITRDRRRRASLSIRSSRSRAGLGSLAPQDASE